MLRRSHVCLRRSAALRSRRSSFSLTSTPFSVATRRTSAMRSSRSKSGRSNARTTASSTEESSPSSPACPSFVGALAEVETRVSAMAVLAVSPSPRDCAANLPTVSIARPTVVFHQLASSICCCCCCCCTFVGAGCCCCCCCCCVLCVGALVLGGPEEATSSLGEVEVDMVCAVEGELPLPAAAPLGFSSCASFPVPGGKQYLVIGEDRDRE